MKPFITKTDNDNYNLHVPMDLIILKNDFDHYFRCTFTSKNLNDLFKEAGFDIALPLSEDKIFIAPLGVFKINIIENITFRTIKLWVMKKGN